MQDGEIVIDAKESRIMQIVEKAHRQGQGTTAIARLLNEQGLTNRRGRPYTHKSVEHLIRKYFKEPA